MSQLDKFKRRLIRSVARLRVDEKKPEKEVWEILSKEMGCDCGPLWDRMRALTMKKLNRLLVCGDCTDTIANVARPSDTDMLMFDLVLVHEDDFDVIGRDLIADKMKDCKALEELFELVQEFSLEETPTAALEETWEEALRYYQAKENRLTSVTLLQRRWYQLKELTRTNFYKLWHSYRGTSHLWDKARAGCSLTDLQVAVAERYPYVITKPFKKWDELIKAGLVVLPHHIEPTAPETSDSAVSGNEQDLLLVEPEVETIDLGVDSDSETERNSCPRDATVQPKSKEVLKLTNEINAAPVEGYNPNITIKTEPPDFDGLSNVKILEATHIPVEQLDDTRQDTIKTEDIDPRVALKNDLLRNISKCIESTDELIKQCDPQEDQCENVQNALNEVENQMVNMIEPRSSDNVIEQSSDKVNESDPQTSKHNKDEVIQGKAYDYFKNKILEDMGKFSNNEEPTEDIVQPKGRTDDDKLCRSNVTEDNIKDSLSSEKLNTVDDVRSSEEEEVLEDIIKQTADDFVKKSKHSRSEQGTLTLTDLTIVDDGIDFVDDGIEYKEDNEDMKMEIDADNDSSIRTKKHEDKIHSIDLKLLMVPIILTTRLNDMLTFKDGEFESVVDRSTIDLAELESKPKQAVKEPIKDLQVKQENKCDDDSNTEADDSNTEADDCSNDVIGDDQRVKLTSYLLQKPRSRSYNPIQLCKNPDFNTRLKRLTFGFLSSERNRQILSTCKPATVDLHKDFEDKLVNGTLYLKRSVTTDFVKESSVQKDDQSVRTVSVVPSAMSVQSLIDSSKMKFQPSSTVSSIDLTFDDMSERNKVIHLPDITQVRRINQKLLTAEVPPIRVQNNVTSAVASNHLEVQPAVKNTVVTNEETAGIGQKTDFYKTSQVINKNTSPLLSNLLVSHRPPSFPKSSIMKNAHLHTKESTSALKVSTTQKVPEKLNGTPPTNPDKPPANPDKPPRKPPTRPICPYLSWNKPVIHTRPLDDFLITHDTLLKILAKAKNQSELFTYCIGKKNASNMYKNSQKGLKDTKGKQKEPDIKKNKQEEGKKIEVIENDKRNKQEESKKIEVIEDKRDTQRGKITKMKPRVRAKKGIMKTICCWARAWVFKYKGQLLRLPKHMCPVGKCNCCCKHELPQSISKETYENSEPIELSDEESDKKLTSVTKVIEYVVQQSIQAPVPKLRIYSTDKHNLNEEDTNINLGSTDSQKNTPRVESVCDCNEVESSMADNTLQDVLIDDESAPVAGVHGEVSVVADEIVQKKSICVETSTEKPKKIYVIPEAKMMQINANNPNVKPNFQVVSATNQRISTQKQGDFIPPLISSSVSKKMYVKAIYSKPSQKPPSVSMSTQTIDVPLLQNLSIEQEGIKKPDVIHQKQLVVDGTRPFTTPTTIINRKTEQVIHLKASKLSSSNPIYLGKNQILLTTVKYPSNFESPKKESDRNENSLVTKVVPSFPLPEGVEIVLQPNGELACIVKPGTELESTQLSMLPSILETIKQQINTQQPHVISDVINLSDDENDQNNEENKKISKKSQENALTTVVTQTQDVEKSPREQMVEYIENALTSVVPQTHDVEKSPRKQMVEDTENALTPVVAQTQDVEKSPRKQMVEENTHIENQENCKETGNEAKLTTQPQNMTPMSKVCNDSLQNCKEESNRENISDNQKSIREEANICQVQGADTVKSQTCVNNPTKTDENRNEDQTFIKNTTMTENKKCEEDNFVDNTNSSTETEAESKHSAGSRNLLSDLMQMSGISEEDTKTTSDTSLPTLPAVINIDPVNVNVANEINFPDLTPVVSVAQLKYACEQNGKFFKLDFDTGTLVPLSVCIKKKGFNTCISQSDTVEFAVKETGSGDKVGIPANPKVCTSVTPYASSSATSSTFSERKNSIIVHRYKRNRKNPVFSKPITILRHTRSQSLLLNHLQTKAIKRPRKEIPNRIEAKIDLVDSDAPMEEEYLINSESDDDMVGTSNVPSDRTEFRRLAAHTVTEISDDSSDDEPLALKSKRLRLDLSIPTQAASETPKNINEEHEKTLQEFLRIRGNNIVNEDVEKEAGPTDADNMELDTSIPAGAILEDIVPEPEEGDSFESESSPEDCILGM